EGATGKPFVRYWLHAQHLQAATGEKMSRRLKNFATVRELLAEGYTPRAIRYALLPGAHYRSPLAFSPELLNAADSAAKRSAEVDPLIAEREAARKRRDFARADEIRRQFLAMGIQLDDTKDGARWKRIR